MLASWSLPLLELSSLLSIVLLMVLLVLLLLRGTVVNRTYGLHKNLPGIYLTIFTIFGPIYYGPPQ